MRTHTVHLLVLGLLGLSGIATAQQGPAVTSRWELTGASGTVIPTGAQRQSIRRGGMSTAQLSWLASPFMALNATLGWARSRDVATAGDPKLDIFTYDMGVDLRAPRLPIGRAITIMPFSGYGVGARSYNYRSLDVDATHNAAGYVSFGGELAVARIRLRLEGRDYVSGFKPLAGSGSTDVRNDVVVLAGLRFVRR